jgi:hypothetical protein
VLEGGRSNQEIKIGNHLASTAKVRTDSRKNLHCGIVEAQYGKCAKKLPDSRNLQVRFSRICGTIIEFTARDDADGRYATLKCFQCLAA